MILAGVIFVLRIFAAIGFGDVVDQAFIQRPGINLALPVVDDLGCRSGRLPVCM